MKIPELSNDLNIISKLGDNPGADDGLTAEGLKAKFDEGSLTIQQYINGVLIAKLNEIFAEGGQLNEGLIMTGPINMNQQMLFGLKNPVNDSEPVNLGFAIANYAPKNHVDNKSNPHGVTAEPAGAAPTGFGLGTGCVTIDSVKSITKNGWYLTQGDVPLAGVWLCNAKCSADAYNIIVDAYSADGKLHARYTKNGAMDEWEWVIPPLNIDVEYKTTERWYSYPVYVRMINMGALPNNSVKSYAISDHAGGGRIISAEGFENASGQKIPSACFATDFAKIVDLPFSGLNLIIQTNFDGSAFTQALVTAKYIKY